MQRSRSDGFEKRVVLVLSVGSLPQFSEDLELNKEVYTSAHEAVQGRRGRVKGSFGKHFLEDLGEVESSRISEVFRGKHLQEDILFGSQSPEEGLVDDFEVVEEDLPNVLLEFSFLVKPTWMSSNMPLSWFLETTVSSGQTRRKFFSKLGNCILSRTSGWCRSVFSMMMA